MEQTAALIVLLTAVLIFLFDVPRRLLQNALRRGPRWIWAAPLVLTALFGAAAAMTHVSSLPLLLTVLLYTAAPVLCAYAQGPGPVSRPSAVDFLIILLLWLPIEFNAGASLIPRHAQGFLHSVAYGIAILLGLIIFLGFRAVDGMKYNLPGRARDYWLPLSAFAVTAPVLAMVGIAIGFIPPPHVATQSMSRMLAALGIIFAGTALPEEILFRSLIQNFLTLRFGDGVYTLLIAALIFGSAHLDNGPQPLPNWRYMILASIAGVAYGFVFRRSSTVLSSALLHMLVDWTKHFFF
jgi:uncharacterized protein